MITAIYGFIVGVITLLVASYFYEFFSSGWWTSVIVVGVFVIAFDERKAWNSITTFFKK